MSARRGGWVLLALLGAALGPASAGAETTAPGAMAALARPAEGFGAPAADPEADFRAALAGAGGAEGAAGAAVPTLEGGLLAQRTIEREWGPATDTLPQRMHAAGWKSEPFAFSASALLPGAGQAYSGENSAVWFAVAEIAGWTARWLFHRDADRGRDAAIRIAGNPADSTSGWSFRRWESAGAGRDPSDLEALWAADPSAFYAVIASDPRYLDGWSAAGTRDAFEHERDLADAARTRARWTEGGIGLNHLFAAVDALRAARLHNLPVRRNLELGLRGHWGRRGPALVAVLERRF